MTIILGMGMHVETVVQITLCASLLEFFIGSLMSATPYKRRHGFEGYSCKGDRLI
jgi:hypothetical protein